jgi:hypothetical protein
MDTEEYDQLDKFLSSDPFEIFEIFSIFILIYIFFEIL